MKPINIAKVLVNKRREKGVTQDELANYIGVSKASVSKWETGQSYPDITFLPELASYFNISIDELMCYEPQMIKEDIAKLYHSLSAEFSSRPFNEVMDKCRENIKKYYSCFPLLMQMGVLILNHSMLSGNEEERISLIEEAKEIFVRIRKESEDIELSKQALLLEGNCYLALGKPNETLELLEELSKAPLMMVEHLMASAYQMVGKIKEGKAILQAGIYQNVVNILGFLTTYLMLSGENEEEFERVLKRGLLVSDAFDIKNLHPSQLCSLYIVASQGYMARGLQDKALDMMEKYTEIVTGDIYPIKLHGDEFFNLIDDFLNELPLGTAAPREEKVIKEGMETAITKNPLFNSLEDNIRFKRIVEKLKNNY